jgi:uncharacterized protein (DUF342 family)
MQLKQQAQQIDAMDRMAKHQRETQKLALDKAQFDVSQRMDLSKEQREWVKQQIEQSLAAAEIQLEREQKRPVGLREM